MFCGDHSLVNHSEELSVAVTAFCNCWTCPNCVERRQTKLIAQAIAGKPNRFLTLTANPAYGEGPSDRLKALAKSWRLFVQTYRRRSGGATLEYLATVEETKAGEPHLHILIRSKSIPHALISAWMQEHMDSPIVYIEAIKKARNAARYVAKYASKKPAQFDTSKRYWQSSNYVIPDPEREAMKIRLPGKFQFDSRPVAHVSFWWETAGATILYEDEHRVEARPPPYAREFAT